MSVYTLAVATRHQMYPSDNLRSYAARPATQLIDDLAESIQRLRLELMMFL